MKFDQDNLLTYPRQTIDTKTQRWDDVVGYCPFCKFETIISGYACLNDKLIQECCTTCGDWWNIHETTLLPNITMEQTRSWKVEIM